MRTLALFALLAVSAAASAQQHVHDGATLEAHGPNVVIDVANEDVVAGQPVIFTVMLLDDASLPVPHQDMRFRVRFADRVLLESTLASGHDYDGFNEFAVMFPSPGPWRADLLGEDGEILAKLDGWAVHRDPRFAEARLEGPRVAQVHELLTYTMWPADANGSSVTHFYTQFEVWGDDGVLLQAKLHSHNPHQVNESIAQLAFQEPGRYTLRAQMYQADTHGVQRHSYDPISTQLEVDVSGDAAAASPDGTPDSWLLRNATDAGALVATFDPQPVVGLGTLTRLAVRAQALDGALRTHVDFYGELRDSAGRVLFASNWLHESDALLQVFARPGVPGGYTWHVQADGNGTRIEVPFQVRDAALEPAVLEFTPPSATAGQPVELAFRMLDSNGAPVQHAEVLVRVLDAAGRQTHWAKLHTHVDGAAAVTATFLSGGEHTLVAQPFSLAADGTTFAAQEFRFAVAEGEAWPVQHKPKPAAQALAEPGAGNAAIAAAAAVAVLGLGGAGSYAWWRSRRPGPPQP